MGEWAYIANQAFTLSSARDAVSRLGPPLLLGPFQVHSVQWDLLNIQSGFHWNSHQLFLFSQLTSRGYSNAMGCCSVVDLLLLDDTSNFPILFNNCFLYFPESSWLFITMYHHKVTTDIVIIP